MNIKKFSHPLMDNNIIDSDINSLISFLKNNKKKIFTQSAKVIEFEKKWSKWLGTRYSVFVTSGSSANLLAISALCSPHTTNRLKKGDEVIVPSLSWSTTVWPLVQNGLVPVVADINPKTLNIDVKNIKKLATAPPGKKKWSPDKNLPPARPPEAQF